MDLEPEVAGREIDLRGSAQSAVSRYLIGSPPKGSAAGQPGDHLVALTLEDVQSVPPTVPWTPFHLAVRAPAKPAAELVIHVPTWRGYSFARLLEWLAGARFGEPGRSRVTWVAERSGAAAGLRRILEGRGWELETDRSRGRISYRGVPPPPGTEPEPAAFETDLGVPRLRFAADWGVFGRQQLDEGTRLLLEAALETSPTDLIVDVGSGCGPLAIGLVAAGRSRTAIATEIDCVALALVEANARAAATAVTPLPDGDLGRVPPSGLTVCNFPTHAPRPQSDRLLGDLCRRSSHGDVLIVVHATLEGRFIGRITAAGGSAAVVQRARHSVLRVSS